jgi:hypothetical protein
LARSAGSLFIADTFNHAIRKVDTAGVITTVAGNGTAGFSGDGGPATSAQFDEPSVAVDTAGYIWIADPGNNRIRRVRPDGIVQTIAGTGAATASGDGGPASLASLDPWTVGFDSDGNILVADHDNNRIRRITRSTATLASAIQVANADGSPGPTWQATVNVPWLTLSATAGQGPSVVSVNADAFDLPPGTYNGVITFTTTDGRLDNVSVTFTVMP